MLVVEQHRLRTLGEIARLLDVPFHRVAYAVTTYEINEATRVGIIRLFDESGVQAIRAALSRIAGRRGVSA